MSSRMVDAPERPSFPRRMMPVVPDASANQAPLPSEEVAFHDPEIFPAEATRPSGDPSGVKKLAFTAAMPWDALAALAESE